MCSQKYFPSVCPEKDSLERWISKLSSCTTTVIISVPIDLAFLLHGFEILLDYKETERDKGLNQKIKCKWNSWSIKDKGRRLNCETWWVYSNWSMSAPFFFFFFKNMGYIENIWCIEHYRTLVLEHYMYLFFDWLCTIKLFI